MGRGALLFKGDTAPKKKRSSVTVASIRKRPVVLAKETESTRQQQHVTTAAAGVRDQLAHSLPIISKSPQIEVGRGKITVSGTVVTGYGTKFNMDIQVGDALVLLNHTQEMRIITMRLSDISLNLSSAFSSSIDTSKPLSYSYIRKPRDVRNETEMEQRKVEIEKAADIERHQNAFSSVLTATTATTAAAEPSSSNTKNAVYRERTEHGNYRIKHISVSDETNRSDMLDLRSKKTSDKYC